MGVIYVVLPLDHEIAHWLVQQGVDCPAGQSGRNPTVLEVRAALGEMADIRYHQSRGTGGDGWEIEVMDRAANGRWASIRSSGARDSRAPIAFHKGGRDLIVEIAYRLSARTGPLVLIPDTGQTPVPVWTGRSLRATLTAFGE